MSASDHKSPPRVPNPDEAAQNNPHVDVGQLREAETVLDELSKQGIARPKYDIASPYERRPLRRKPD